MDYKDVINPLIVAVATAISALLYRKFGEWKDSKKIFDWLKKDCDKGKYKYRSTQSISSTVNLPEDRINELCIRHKKIHKSTGKIPNMWTVDPDGAGKEYESNFPLIPITTMIVPIKDRSYNDRIL